MVTDSSSFRRSVIPAAELTSDYMPKRVFMGLLPVLLDQAPGLRR